MGNNKISPEDYSLTPWCFAGIFRINCIPTNRAYFEGTKFELLFVTRIFLENLKNGYCDNIELLNDFKKYGLENFEVEMLVAGPEYCDEITRNKALEEYKASWSGELY